MTGSARVYGGSLFDLAREEGREEVILDQMEQIRQIFREIPEYPRLLAEPSIPLEERQKLLDEALGEDADHYLRNFLKLLMERGGLGMFADCHDVFRRRYDADHDIARAEITSAVALDEKQIEALRTRLESMCGKTLRIHTHVDASVMGGISVELDGKRMDGTVAGRLAGISKRIEEISLQD